MNSAVTSPTSAPSERRRMPPVTITSEDPGAPATFAGLRLDGAANLTFDNVVFDYTYKSEHNIWSAPNFVRVSSDIIIRN